MLAYLLLKYWAIALFSYCTLHVTLRTMFFALHLGALLLVSLCKPSALFHVLSPHTC